MKAVLTLLANLPNSTDAKLSQGLSVAIHIHDTTVNVAEINAIPPITLLCDISSGPGILTLTILIGKRELKMTTKLIV